LRRPETLRETCLRERKVWGRGETERAEVGDSQSKTAELPRTERT